MGTRLRRMAAVVSAGVPVLVIATLAAEVALAMHGPRLPESEPYVLDEPGDTGAEHVVWLGDSTAAGVGATDPDTALPRLVQSKLFTRSRLTVLAISGATVDDVVKDQLPKVAALHPTRVFISVGANDTTHLTSQRKFKEAYDALLNALPPDSAVTVLGVPDMGAPTVFAQPLRAIAGARGQQLNDVVKAVVADHNVTYVDIARETRYYFRSQPRTYFAMDHFHPNNAGYQLWADAILPAVVVATAGSTKP